MPSAVPAFIPATADELSEENAENDYKEVGDQIQQDRQPDYASYAFNKIAENAIRRVIALRYPDAAFAPKKTVRGGMSIPGLSLAGSGRASPPIPHIHP